MQKSDLLKGTLIGAGINAAINGVINWFQVKDQAAILLAEDHISGGAHTVLSGAVPLATSLAFILSSIVYATWKHTARPPYFWTGFWLSLKHAIFAFGAMIVLGVLISRIFGEVYFTPIQSALFAALVAALTAGLVDYLTKSQMLHRSATKGD